MKWLFSQEAIWHFRTSLNLADYKNFSIITLLVKHRKRKHAHYFPTQIFKDFGCHFEISYFKHLKRHFYILYQHFVQEMFVYRLQKSARAGARASWRVRNTPHYTVVRRCSYTAGPASLSNNAKRWRYQREKHYLNSAISWTCVRIIMCEISFGRLLIAG